MKTTAYYIGGGLVFLALAFIIVGKTNQLNEHISTISVAHAASSHADVMSFPLEVKFNRPVNKAVKAFPEVKFNHFDHQDVSCMTCHHTWDGSNKIESCATRGCHDDFSTRTSTESYFFAYHTRGSTHSCVGCHQHLTNSGEANLPSSPCGNNACHAKE